MKTITLNIDGMMCGHCEQRVTAAVLKLDGLVECLASAKENTVRITFDESKVDEEAIKAAIDEIGYDVK